jgi:hypothetical protein
MIEDIHEKTDDKLMVNLRERCSVEAFQMWIDSKMPGWVVKRVMAEQPCNISIVVEKKS